MSNTKKQNITIEILTRYDIIEKNIVKCATFYLSSNNFNRQSFHTDMYELYRKLVSLYGNFIDRLSSLYFQEEISLSDFLSNNQLNKSCYDETLNKITNLFTLFAEKRSE